MEEWIKLVGIALGSGGFITAVTTLIYFRMRMASASKAASFPKGQAKMYNENMKITGRRKKSKSKKRNRNP